MAQTEDRKLAEFIRADLPMLRDRLAPLRVIAFGSRVRGDALSTSDLDLILVSPRFAAVPFLRRPVEVLEMLDYPGGLELLCYTPEEFEEKRRELGIVRVAIEEGITL
ncbi:MAG: nucleotidyltransferase domain-containing protein [candidate division NC10 bacterium]